MGVLADLSSFVKAAISANGSIQLSGTGYPNLIYTVQASTNLASTNWLTIGTTAADPTGALRFIDTNATTKSSRYYRFVIP